MKPLVRNAPDRESRRVLVAKTSSAPAMRHALLYAEQHFPGAEIVVWSEERESDDFYGWSRLQDVIIYRNILAIPPMGRALYSFNPHVVITQRTFEGTYDKMKLLALLLFTGQGIALDEQGQVVLEGGWWKRSGAVMGEVILAGGWRFGARQIGRAVAFLPLRLAARLIVFPFVLIGLLLGAASIGLRRWSYLARHPDLRRKL